MNKLKFVLVASVLAFVLVFSVVIPAAAAAPLHVDDDGVQRPGAYTTITEALAYAASGDKIIVHEGEYNETVFISKNDISLKAEGNVVLDGSTVTPIPDVGTFGIFVTDDVHRVTIKGFDVRDYTYGIAVGEDATNNSIKANRVSSCGEVVSDGDNITVRGGGIVIFGSDNIVKNNEVSDSVSHGILLVSPDFPSSLPTVTNNIVAGNIVSLSGGYGILVTRGADSNVVKGNHITNSGQDESFTLPYWDGIRIGGDYNRIEANQIADSRYDGIDICGGDSNLVTQNTVLNNGRFGISIRWYPLGDHPDPESNYNLIQRNIVSGSIEFDLYDYGEGTGNNWEENIGTSNF